MQKFNGDSIYKYAKYFLDNVNDDISADFQLFRSKSHYGIDYGVYQKLIGDLVNGNFQSSICVCVCVGLQKNIHRTRCVEGKVFFLLCFRSVCFVVGLSKNKKSTENRRKQKFDYLCTTKRVCKPKIMETKDLCDAFVYCYVKSCQNRYI